MVRFREPTLQWCMKTMKYEMKINWSSQLCYAHYVDWDFKGENRSYLQFLQKPFILDVCKPLKKNENFLWWTSKIFPLIYFGIAWTGRTNPIFALVYSIKFLSIWPFVHHPCFSTEKVSKVAFFLFQQQNSHGFILWLFLAERGKMTLLRTFWWENKDDVWNFKCLEI